MTEEPGEASERKRYELYKVTHPDIPGYPEDFPWLEEWRKWSIALPGVRPEWIHIAKDGERYAGVVTLQRNEQTQAMYHEYTGVLREYRGRGIALALKMFGSASGRNRDNLRWCGSSGERAAALHEYPSAITFKVEKAMALASASGFLLKSFETAYDGSVFMSCLTLFDWEGLSHARSESAA